MTKQGAFAWSGKAQQAFDHFKQLMGTYLVLAILDFIKLFKLECHASNEGIRVLLMQNKHPIAFESRKLRGGEKSYSIYDKEMLAIMHALAKVKKYLVGGRFIVKTNHNSIKYFINQKDLNDTQQKWVSKLQAYDFDIEYVKGKRNIEADALSRRPHLCSISEIATDWNEQIQADYLIFSRIMLVPKTKIKE